MVDLNSTQSLHDVSLSLASGLSYQIILIQPLELEVHRRIRPDIQCFFQDPAGSGSGQILRYEDLFEDPVKSGSGWIQTVWIRSTGFITM